MDGSWIGFTRQHTAVLAFSLCAAAVKGTVGEAQSLPQSQAAISTTATSTPPPSSLAFIGVTIVNVETGQLFPEQTVVITGNRVRSISPASTAQIPSGAHIVDAKGQYMIPGIWDMHTHVDGDADLFYPRFIAHGITGLREMAQRFPNGPDSLLAWQREIMAGTRVGPRIIGPSADFPYDFAGLGSQDEIVRTIDSLKASGMIFLKYHDTYGERNLFFAMAHEARRIGIPFVGHIPTSVTSVEAADSGLHSIEHIDEQRQCWPNFPEPLGDSVEVDKRCGPVAQAYIRNGTWVVPTFGTFWPEPSPHHQSAGVFKDALRMIRVMHQSGVQNFLAGTDWVWDIEQKWEMQFMPGLSGAEELVFFQEAGFTPLEALQTGTLNPAKFLNATDSLGTVAIGKLADLVLLNGNPLADVHNVLNVQSVVANGRYFDRTTLDSLDPAGTKPNTGLIALEQFRQKNYSSNFVVGTDTIEVPLTEDLFARYASTWTALQNYWKEHSALMDSAKAYEDYPVVPGMSTAWRKPVKQIPLLDYVALTQHNSALSDIFQKNGLPPEQFGPVQMTLVKNVLRLKKPQHGDQAGGKMNTKTNMAVGNMAFVEAHKSELAKVGAEF